MSDPCILVISVPAGQPELQTMVQHELSQFGDLYPEPPRLDLSTLNLILEATKHAVDIAGGVAVALESIRRLRDVARSTGAAEILIGKEGGPQHSLSEVDEALLRNLLGLSKASTDQ